MAIFRRVITILLGLAATGAYAAPAISLEKSTPEGVLQNAFTQQDGKWVYVKNTNFFDGSEASLGIFEISNQKSLDKPTKELERIETALKKMEKKFPESASVDKKLYHQSHYKVGNYTIPKGHPLYERTQKVFEALKFNAKTHKQSGVRLDFSKAPRKIKLKEGKVISQEPFSVNFECDKRETDTICDIKDYGLLFLNKRK